MHRLHFDLGLHHVMHQMVSSSMWWCNKGDALYIKRACVRRP